MDIFTSEVIKYGFLSQPKWFKKTRAINIDFTLCFTHATHMFYSQVKFALCGS